MAFHQVSASITCGERDSVLWNTKHLPKVQLRMNHKRPQGFCGQPEGRHLLTFKCFLNLVTSAVILMGFTHSTLLY